MKLKIKLGIIAFLVFFVPFHLSLAALTGMKNPAATYCVDLGYEYSIVHTDEGDLSVCIFPDGTETEIWTFFSGQESREFNYCTKNGLNTKTVSDERCAYNIKCTLCVFEDGSEEEVTKYMNLNVFTDNNEINNNAEATQGNLQDSDTQNTNYQLFFVLLVVFMVLVIILKKLFQKKK